MTSLDLRSFTFLAALQCVVMGTVLLGMRRNGPVSILGLRLWGGAPLLALLSTLFYGLQGIVPAVVVGIGGNGLLMAATLALLAGTTRFLDRPWRWWPWATLFSVCMVGLLAFFVVWPDYRPRMLIFALGMAAICAAHTRILALYGRGFPARLMLVAMGWQTLVLLTRALATYWIDAPTTERFDGGSLIHSVYIGTFSCSILVVLVGAQLMVNERVRQRFEHLASHDDLTGAFNRRAILDLIEEEHEHWKRYQQPYALLLVDVDYFKRVNDTYGHQAGDRALKMIAQTLQRGLRKVDRLGRYGGEEFIVLLHAAETESAMALADRLRISVEKNNSDANTPNCTVSIGVTVVRPGDETLDPVVGRADQALYEAKAAGRNRVVPA